MKAKPRHKSDSHTQRQAEEWVRMAYKKQKLNGPVSVELNEGSTVSVDALSANGNTAFEIYVHQGQLKSGQRRKIAMDILKLVALGHSNPSIKNKVLLLADPDLAASLREGKSWLSEAIRGAGVRIECVTLTDEQVREILKAQNSQRNPSG